MSFRTQLWIGGAYVDAAQGGTFTNMNPTTGAPLCEVASATKEDVDRAVKVAKETLYGPNWGYASTKQQRSAVLRRLGEIFTEKKDELSRLDSLDHGKPLREANADLDDAISACAHFADLCDKREDEAVDNGTDGAFTTTIVHEPIGVVGAITPWNYPLLMAIWKVVPAIAAGCCIVLKPSELAPLSCIYLAELCKQAGLPDGALNVVPGLGPSAGAALTANPDIDKISFTGSLPTAQRIMSAASMGPRAVSLELGGKSPLIVFDDAPVDAAVDWIILGICWGSGQVCSATSRVFLQKGIRAAIMTRLVERVKAIKIGDSLDAAMVASTGPTMGPVINQLQYDKIWAFIDEAMADARITCAYGGRREIVKDDASLAPGGYWVPPTVLVDVPQDCRVWKEEVFGPVLCIREFDTEAEAVSAANDSEYGLAAAVFSADAARADRVARAMRAGIVWKNCCQPAFIQAPWGGVKKSGFGRELGRWGLEEFTSVKQVTSCAPGFSFEMW